MNKQFVTRLKELRGSMSQDEFASIIGAKQTSYSSWERGIKEPSISNLLKIASTLGVSSDWLLGLSDERTVAGTFAMQPKAVASPVKSGAKTIARETTGNEELLRAIRELQKRVTALESTIPLASCG